MQTADQTIPFRISTYKVSFHTQSSNSEGFRQRIFHDLLTDVWCLQGANLSKRLKSPPAAYDIGYLSGLAFVHNKERVRLVDKSSVNLVPPLLAAASRRPSVADSFCVSRFHLSKLKIFVGFAAYEAIPQSSPTATASSLPLPPMQSATQRVLIVNVDFERYHRWGHAFYCNLLCALFRQIWDGHQCFTSRWECTHVCLAGSFFFVPGSPPYRLMTSLSGGLVEEVVAQVVVPPFKRLALEESEADAASKEAVLTCVVAAGAEGDDRCHQLLGVQMRRGAADGPVATLIDLSLSCLNPATEEYDAEESLSCDADGWWMLSTPRDTSNEDPIVSRLAWPCDDTPGKHGEYAPVFFRFRVRSFGVLSPRRQDADGLRIGEALLRSATANTVSAYAAAQFGESLRLRVQSTSHVEELMNDTRQALGEPIVTALYRDGADILPDCYDYVFVTTFTGAAVQSTSLQTMADFEQETATPHLPIYCTLTIPCMVR